MQTISSLIKVLLLEDSHNGNESIESLLSTITKYEVEVYSVSDLTKGLDYLKHNLVDLALINLKDNGIYEENVRQKIYAISPRLPLVFVIANKQQKISIQNQNINLPSQQRGTQDFLVKHRLSASLLESSIAHVLAETWLIEQLQKVKEDNLQLKSQLEDTQELFKTVVDSTSTLMWMIDAEENYTFLNQAWLSFTGKTLEEGLKENWRDRIHPEDLTKCDRAYQSALKKCQGFQIEYRIGRFDAVYRTILNTAVRRHNSKGEYAGLLCSCLDITQRKKIEEKVIRQAQTDRILADITQKIHGSLDLDIILQTAAEQVDRYLLADKVYIAKIIDKRRLCLLFESRLNSTNLTCNCSPTKQLPTKQLVDNFQQLAKGEIVAQDNTSTSEIFKTGSLALSCASYSLLLVPIISHHELWGLLCVEQKLQPRCWQPDEIRLLKRVAIQLGIAIKQSELYQELEELSVVDGLTKIANRRKFDRYIVSEWKRLAREKRPLSLILCDVDHFKLYNDTYGHQAGDRCLKIVAQAISKVIKRPADLSARYGGEEFAVILPNTNAEGAKYLAQQIRLKIESLKIPHINSPVDLYVTLSFGVASCIPNGKVDASALVSAADRGLYQAKELGRNQVVDTTWKVRAIAKKNQVFDTTIQVRGKM
ncbi:MAG: diguanylate cyclase [Pleurocapsa sp. MO_226.B13]|nr:diguanylate cyclase [Pleurocapsa sp. MO_226.B13]